MQPKHGRAGFALLMWTMVAACGETGTPTERLGDDLAAAECDAFFTCAETDADYAEWIIELGSRSQCVRELREDYVNPLLDEAIRNGTVSIDHAALRECTRRMRRMCSSSPWPCGQVLVGHVPDGGACRLSSECVNDGWCNRPLGAECGTCNSPAPTPLGQPCGWSIECAPSELGRTECRYSLGSPTPTCQVVPEPREAGAGEPCGWLGLDEAQQVYCKPGLYCAEGATSSICVAPLPVGALCDEYDDACVAGAVCREGEDDVERCREVIVRRRAGETCDEDADSPIYCSEAANLICDPGSKTCRLLGDGSLGTSCQRNANCKRGLQCQWTSGEYGVCVELKPLGATCQGSWDECASGYCARTAGSDTFTCQDPSAAVCK